MASWGSLAHITVAGPGALLSFLGPRVYEAINGTPFPKNVQVAEHLFDKGLIDSVVPPSQLSDVVDRALSILVTGPTPHELGEAFNPVCHKFRMLHDACRGRPHTGVLGQNHPSSAQQRRRSQRQPCQVSGLSWSAWPRANEPRTTWPNAPRRAGARGRSCDASNVTQPSACFQHAQTIWPSHPNLTSGWGVNGVRIGPDSALLTWLELVSDSTLTALKHPLKWPPNIWPVIGVPRWAGVHSGNARSGRAKRSDSRPASHSDEGEELSLNEFSCHSEWNLVREGDGVSSRFVAGNQDSAPTN